MVNLVEFEHVISILDQIASRPIVDRALRHAEINRNVLRSGPGFLPYVTETIVLESVARSLGEQHLGFRVGMAFDYGAYQACADYVLGAHNLAAALVRARRVLPLIHPGSHPTIRATDRHLVIGYASGLEYVIGHRHLEDGAVSIWSNVFQYFLGADWCPDWIEVVRDKSKADAALEDMTSSSVLTSAQASGFAVRLSDLNTPNPTLPQAKDVVTLSDLPSLMGITQPQTMADIVMHAIRMQHVLADVTIDSVGRRLSMGPRTLQRALQVEGTSFREVRTRYVAERATALLSDPSLAIGDIARSVGYAEPNNFRRAFRAWTGLSPSSYRNAHHGI